AVVAEARRTQRALAKLFVEVGLEERLQAAVLGLGGAGGGRGGQGQQADGQAEPRGTHRGCSPGGRVLPSAGRPSYFSRGGRGWPGKSLVGVDGANAAWLLVQHADQGRAFQKRCLPLLEAAVKKGEATGVQLAYLSDRVRVGAGEKQVYGTQFRTVDGKLE